MLPYINDYKEEYIVLSDSDTVLNIDLNKVIELHEKNNAKITFVTTLTSQNYVSRTPKLMISKDNDRIVDISLNTTYTDKCPELVLNIFILRTDALKRIISEAKVRGISSLTSLFLSSYKKEKYCAYSHRGYVATVSEITDYYKYSIELAKNEASRRSLLANKDFPIYTRVKNSAPTLYTDTAYIKSSIIADDCVIEGEVENSVIFRGVHVGRGAKIKNSILFHGTTVDCNSNLNSIITDKFVTIGRGVNLSGDLSLPFYIEKNRKI
jgi:glucose-1-phosphate adenylyltransferase